MNSEKSFMCSHSESSCNAKKDRLDKQFAFILEADKEKLIERQTYLSAPVQLAECSENETDAKNNAGNGTLRKENDAEHAWHLALMTILLQEYANEPIDVLKTVTMVLLHDIVEIDAGDTYAYDEAGKADQKAREEAAAQRIYGMLPKDQAEKMYAIWKEFEKRKTPEAKFARAMDNLQPMMLNHAADGRAWEEHGVFLGQILKRNVPTPEGSKVLWEYAKEHFLEPSVKTGRIKKDCEL